MPAVNRLDPIPHPPKKPLLGNMLAVDPNAPIASLVELAKSYGPIFWLDMRGYPIVFVTNYALVDELCDETRFDKTVKGALKRVRTFAGDGLFTADTHAPNWSKAHNILIAPFGNRAMQTYHPMMVDIAEQLCLKWERLNADEDIDVVHDMTALTLDTIGLCGFDYRFNSFYRRDYHPYVEAMVRSLETAMLERGLPFESVTLRTRKRDLSTDVSFMNGMVDQIVAERRNARETAQKDLLGAMMTGVDRASGEQLDDVNIRYQINTFLIAGHETTSGLLSYSIYAMLKDPDILAKAVAEVDRVLGNNIAVPPTFSQVVQLTYITQILKEALRLWPPAPAFSLSPYKDEVIGGKFKIPEGTFVNVIIPTLHRDPAVWGPRAEIFDPENFAPEVEAKRPANAWKPFGNGQRACIGRGFAMHEAALALGMLLQRFTLVDHTRYQLKTKETLTVKPDGFKIKARAREDRVSHEYRPVARWQARPTRPSRGRNPLHDRHTARLFSYCTAPTSARPRSSHTASPRTPRSTDSRRRWRRSTISSASYRTTVRLLCSAPPTTARRRTTQQNSPHGWNTPRPTRRRAFVSQCSAVVTANGQRRTSPCRDASTNGSRPSAASEFWHAAKGMRVTISTANTRPGSQPCVPSLRKRSAWKRTSIAIPACRAIVRDRDSRFGDRQPGDRRRQRAGDDRRLQVANCRVAKRALNVRRSTSKSCCRQGLSYRVGDHLSVVPRNDPARVAAIARRFGLAVDTTVRLRANEGRRAQLPVDQPITVGMLLGHFLEVQGIATRKAITTMAAHTRCPMTRPKLLALAADMGEGSDAYRADVLAKRKSVFDLLEEFPACELPFAAYLEALSLLTPRYYSISSSPSLDAARCSITVGVVAGPARSGQGTYRGVCSHWLAGRVSGDVVFASVRETKAGFRLPDDNAVPIIMIGPGTGLAPFRGFLQERKARKAKGAALGPALLFFGCRRPDHDYLYADELKQFEADGIVDLRVAFSRAETPKAYVQDLVRAEGDRVWDLIEKGAIVFICGDGGKMEPDVKRALMELHQAKTGSDTAGAKVWIDSMGKDARYVLDVWAGS